MKHEEPRAQVVAGLVHVGFAIAYAIAIVYHLKGAREHFLEAGKCK